MNTPKISIIISCYNDKHVSGAVKSALSQDYINKEIILIDDGSDKEVAESIKRLGAKVDRAIIQPNFGQSIARNNGIKVSTGKYILNHDSDDFFDPAFCSKAVNILEQEKEVKIVTCKAHRIYEEKVVDVYTPAGGDYRAFLYSNAALGSSMFRKEDWKRVGGYEEELPILGFEDWEFYLNILKNGGTAKVINEILFNYRMRKESTTRRISHLRNNKFKQIIQKHRELYLQNFDGLIENLFSRMDGYQRQIQKIKESPERKLGVLVLRPLRMLKGFIK